MQTVDVRKLWTRPEKLGETVVDIAAGRLSYSPNEPVLVSRLDSPRGSFFVLDGHHRLVEHIAAGATTIRIEVSPYIPRIERTGGAYRAWINDKVHIVSALLALSEPA